MNITEFSLIALIITQIGISLISLRFIGRMIRESAYALDHSIAEALKTTVENLPDALKDQLVPEMEPINPIQAMIAQMISERMNPTITAQVLPSRSTDGKFEKDTSS